VHEMSAGSESMPAVKHYEQKEFSGMFEYSKDDELIVVKKLILGLHPRLTQLTASYNDNMEMCLFHSQRTLSSGANPGSRPGCQAFYLSCPKFVKSAPHFFIILFSSDCIIFHLAHTHTPV